MNKITRLPVRVDPLEPSSAENGVGPGASGRRGGQRAVRRLLAAAAPALGALLFAGSAQGAAPVQCRGVLAGYYTSGLEAQQWWQTGWDGIYPRHDGAFWKSL